MLKSLILFALISFPAVFSHAQSDEMKFECAGELEWSAKLQVKDQIGKFTYRGLPLNYTVRGAFEAIGDSGEMVFKSKHVLASLVPDLNCEAGGNDEAQFQYSILINYYTNPNAQPLYGCCIKK